MGSQRVRYNLATEQQQKKWNRIKIQESYIKIKNTIPHMMSFLCVKIFVLRSIVGYDAKCLFLVEDVTKVFLKISLIKSYLLIPFHTDMNISKAISSLFILNFLPFLPLLFFTHSGPAVFHHFLFQLKAEIHLVSTKVINDPSHFFVNSIYTEAFSRHPRTYKNSCWLSKTRMKCSDTNVIMEWANREDVINLRTCSPGLTSSCQSFHRISNMSPGISTRAHNHPKIATEWWKEEEEEAERKIPEHSETL